VLDTRYHGASAPTSPCGCGPLRVQVGWTEWRPKGMQRCMRAGSKGRRKKVGTGEACPRAAPKPHVVPFQRACQETLCQERLGQ